MPNSPDIYNPSIASHEASQQLVGLIYETAVDTEYWPILLKGIETIIETNAGESAGAGQLFPSVSSKPVSTVSSENRYSSSWDVEHHHSRKELRIIKAIVPHIKRAINLSFQYSENKKKRELVVAFLDKIPLGILIVDDKSKIIVANKFASQAVENGVFVVSDNHIALVDEKENEQLNAYINRAIHEEAISEEMMTLKLQGVTPVSILISPYDIFSSFLRFNQRYAAILIAMPNASYEICEHALACYFQLTTAEAKLAKALCSDLSIDGYAKRYKLSKNTVRTQMKSILSKTDTHSQQALVRMVLSSPAVWSNTAEASPPAPLSKRNSAGKSSCELILADGRALCYSEWGDPDGVPIVLFHSTIGSRLEKFPNDQITSSLGVRLITFDRPGYGRSDPSDAENFLAIVNDVVELVDALNIDKFAVIGNSIGSCYALACGYKIPERIISISTINCSLPVESFKELRELGPTYRFISALTRYTPSLFSRISELQLKAVVREPLQFLHQITANSESDARILQREEYRQAYVDSISESLHLYMGGFVKDFTMFSRSWAFELSQINHNVHIWQGTQCDYVSESIANKLKQRLPNNEFHSRDDGMLCMCANWEAIIQAMLADI